MATMHTGGADEVQLARLLFGDLAATLDRALGADTGSKEQVDRLLDAAARDARAGALGRAAFEGVSVPEAERLERAFAAARTIASWAGLE